jgi:glycosyltransferase 2 family protein
MKFDNRFIFVIIGAIILYAVLLLLSDISLILSKLPNLKIEYLPVILILIPSSWLFLFLRWNLLLKNSKINIPLKENLKIYFAGFALAVTPGKFGELIKSQILKTKFDVPYRNTSSLVLVERLYDLAGAIIVSFIGVLLIGIGEYVIAVAVASIVLILIFVMISSKKLFNTMLKLIEKIKFTKKYTVSLNESYETIRISTKGKIIFSSVLTTSAYWLLESLGVYFILLSFDIDLLNYVHVVATYTSSLILGAASFIPGGLGVVEGSLVGLLNFQGVDISDAFVLVVLIRIFTLWYSVTIGFIALKLSGGLTEKS